LGVFDQLHETGVTMLLVTHDHSVAKAAQRTVYMRDGRIAESVDAR